MKQNNIKVELPHINLAGYTFKPNNANSSILYGLFAITGMNKDVVNHIIENRPYSSLKDFTSKVGLTKVQTLNLIKAGAFDELEGRDRLDILRDYLVSNLKLKTALTSTNLLSIIEKGYNRCTCYEPTCRVCLEARFVRFRKYIMNKNNKVKIEGSKKDFYKLDDISVEFFNQHFIEHMEEDKHYFYNEEGSTIIDKTQFDKVYKEMIKDTLEWLQQAETIDMYNEKLIEEEIIATKSNFELSQLEMQSLNYYYTNHYLDNVDLESYGVKSFKDLSEVPTIASQKTTRNGRIFTTYESCRLAGTIVDVDKNKHMVSLSTTTGVVGVKFRNKGSFIHYTKQISQIQEDGTKKVIEKPWLARHNNILVSGYRMGDIFYVSKYADLEHTVALITGKDKDKLILKIEREMA